MIPTTRPLPLILVVDDNPINLRVVGAELKSSGRYRVIFANNGADALEQANSTSPDLILLDIMMPEMSGYEVCSTLKENHNTCHIPIIFLSAMGEIDNIVEGLEIGGADYITKPFNPAILMARVETHLQLYLARKREHKLLTQERLYAYQNGMIQMRSEILHNLGNAVGGLGIGVQEQKQFIEQLKGLGQLFHNNIDIVHDEEKRGQLEHLLESTATILGEKFPEQMEGNHRQLLQTQKHLYSTLRALRNLADDGFHSTTIDFDSLLSDLTTLLQDEIQQKQIQLKISQKGEIPALFLPRGPLIQALFSLIINSCEAIERECSEGELTTGAGLITLQISIEAASISPCPICLIEVMDNGAGIPPEQLIHVISSSFTTKQQEVGLGLHSAANFIYSIHGTLQLLSEGAHQGTTVQVRVPVTNETSTAENATP